MFQYRLFCKCKTCSTSSVLHIPTPHTHANVYVYIDAHTSFSERYSTWSLYFEDTVRKVRLRLRLMCRVGTESDVPLGVIYAHKSVCLASICKNEIDALH